MLPWVIEQLSDFCRWRARRAASRAKKNLKRSHGWLALEKFIIKKGMGHGPQEQQEAE